MRENLINAVSRDLLSLGDGTISSIMDKLEDYDNLFDANIRNYYELKFYFVGTNCPLFTLYDLVRKGKEVFDEEDCNDRDYDKTLLEILTQVNEDFGVNYILEAVNPNKDF